MGNKELGVDAWKAFPSTLGIADLSDPQVMSDRLHISGRLIQPTGPVGAGCRDKVAGHIYCTGTSTAIRRCLDPNLSP